MATIVMDVSSIAGDCTITDYVDKIDAIAIRDNIALSLSASTGSAPTGQSAGRGVISDICVTRYKDRASPKFAQACAAGTDLGEVSVTLFKDEDGVQPFMVFTLASVYVARYEMDTQDAEGRQFEPHMRLEDTHPPTSWGAIGLLPSTLKRQASEYRPAARSVVGGSLVAPTDKEVERLWLNATTVKWTYTPYVSGVAGGVVEKGYNILTGAELV